MDTVAEVTRLALTREQEHDAGYLLSSRHWRDFLNNQALIGPLGLWDRWRRGIGHGVFEIVVEVWFRLDVDLQRQ